MFRKIVVAYDGSDGAQRALERGVELAVLVSKELWLVSVYGTPRDTASAHAEIEQGEERAVIGFSTLQQAAEAIAGRRGVRLYSVVRHGNVAKSLVDYAREEAVDLLVLGRSGYSGVWEPFLGTTADRVARHAPCSVLIVR